MHVHLVFVTKFRHNVFTDAHLTRMEEIMRAVCADFACELSEFNGEDNLVYLLANFPSKVAVTRLVNSFKAGCARADSSRQLAGQSPERNDLTARETGDINRDRHDSHPDAGDDQGRQPRRSRGQGRSRSDHQPDEQAIERISAETQLTKTAPRHVQRLTPAGCFKKGASSRLDQVRGLLTVQPKLGRGVPRCSGVE